MPSPHPRASNPVETEAKIRVTSFSTLKRRISAGGGRLLSGRALETNTLFDDATGSLRAAGKSFRVRRYGKAGLVTLKGAPRVVSGLKSRVEVETGVESPEVLERILVMLGFRPLFRYQKFREVWSFRRAVICFDDTPLGKFLEIEGTEAVIHRVAKSLGLSSDAFLATSYPALWLEAGRTGDMVFPTKAATA